MQFDFQTVIAIAIVCWSVIVIARRLNPVSKRRRGHCGSCTGCVHEPVKLLQLGQHKIKS